MPQMDLRRILGSNLRRLRKRQALSQEELAHRASVDRTYISSIERGVYAVTIDVLDRLARALDVDAWELLKP
jgi:transcriptional regulator with XRE-family HTH domain